MSIKEEKLALEKKRSQYIRFFLIFMIVGAIVSFLASVMANDILGYIGMVLWMISLVCIVLAYKTGKKYINL